MCLIPAFRSTQAPDVCHLNWDDPGAVGDQQAGEGGAGDLRTFIGVEEISGLPWRAMTLVLAPNARPCAIARVNGMQGENVSILMLEPKASNQMTDLDVLAKRDAAVEWCRHASTHAASYGGKPWRYALIPHDAIAENITLVGLLNNYECV